MFYLQDVLCFAVAFSCVSNFDFCPSFLLSLGIHNVACYLIIPLPWPMGDSRREPVWRTILIHVSREALLGRSLPGCSVSTESADKSGKLMIFPPISFRPFCFWILNNAVKKNYSKLKNRERGCFFKASWNWLAEPHPPGIIWFSRDVYLCLTPSSLLFYWVGQKIHLGFSIRWYGKTWMNALANPIQFC